MEQERIQPNKEKRSNRGSVAVGAVFLLIGAVFLLKQFDYPFPHWLFNWPMILIVVGLVVGAKSGFREPGSLILIALGVIFTLDDLYTDISIWNYAWPIMIIGVGLYLILGIGRRRKAKTDNPVITDPVPYNTVEAEATQPAQEAAYGHEVLDIASVFGGVKKIVLSKNFKGGEIVCVFGGCEVNLTRADISHPVTIEVVTVFGGTKLIIPSNWEVRSEAAAILGGIDDKRVNLTAPDPSKVLIISGTVLFGGIEIHSY
jgi:predicted membrane protein